MSCNYCNPVKEQLNSRPTANRLSPGEKPLDFSALLARRWRSERDASRGYANEIGCGLEKKSSVVGGLKSCRFALQFRSHSVKSELF